MIRERAAMLCYTYSASLVIICFIKIKHLTYSYKCFYRKHKSLQGLINYRSKISYTEIKLSPSD